MNTSHHHWQTYVQRELPTVAKLLETEHIALDTDQPHIKGERFLMQALTTIGGKKLILLGIKTDTNERVVVKVTNDQSGRAELTHERTCRTLLNTMKFSYESFHSPREIFFGHRGGYTIYVSEYIAQTSSFLERPLPEQFSYALRALKAQEQTRATTAGHLRTIDRTFGRRRAHDYLSLFAAFQTSVGLVEVPGKTKRVLATAEQKLKAEVFRIEQYCGFLTHTDFVPHNFRIHDDTLYLLDFSSLKFGNKHEGWARFLNFMTLYHRELESLLIIYVKQNRSKEEYESLTLMRLYRLGEIIAYYTNTLKQSEGDLLKLNTARIAFWTDVLEAELHGTRASTDIVNAYKTTRDHLRSPEEKERQVGLH